MTEPETLQARAAERDSLLGRIVELLVRDERVAAAWLYGSLGRSEGDEWSDLDIWVVVPDEHMDAVRESLRENVSAVARPLLFVDAPQNAPPGGAFLSVVYEGTVCGPQHVDWTWQPLLSATIPDGVKLLVGRAEVPVETRTPEKSLEEQAERARHQTAFFWMMVPVVGKYIARRKPWVVNNLLMLLGYTLEQVRWLVGAIARPPEYPVERGDPPCELKGQLDLLREMAGEMEALMQISGELSGSVQPDAVEQVHNFLSLVPC